MDIFSYLEGHPERTRCLLGLNVEEIEELVEHLKREEQPWNQAEGARVNQRQPGGGAKAKLTTQQEVEVCLLILRQGVTFEIAGLLVGLSKSQAHEVFHKWLGRLRQSIPASLVEEAEKLGEALESTPEEQEWLVDSWEQARDRPQGDEEQRKYYSGKQKRHTFKSQVITREEGKDIVDLIASVRGPSSDISLFREQKQKFSETQRYKGDKAYVGDEQVVTPMKKPKGGELSEEQKQSNREISSDRIYVEHLIRRVRIFRMAQVRYRWNPQKHGEMIGVICGLVRIRLGALKLRDFARRLGYGGDELRKVVEGGAKMALAA